MKGEQGKRKKEFFGVGGASMERWLAGGMNSDSDFIDLH